MDLRVPSARPDIQISEGRKSKNCTGNCRENFQYSAYLLNDPAKSSEKFIGAEENSTNAHASHPVRCGIPATAILLGEPATKPKISLVVLAVRRPNKLLGQATAAIPRCAATCSNQVAAGLQGTGSSKQLLCPHRIVQGLHHAAPVYHERRCRF